MTWWSKEPGVSSDIVFRKFWNVPTSALEELWSYLCCVTNQPTLLSLTAWHLKQMSVTWINDSKDHSRLCLNFLCEKLFWRNMNIHWHFISFFATLRVQVVEVCLQERQEPAFTTQSTSWLLMTWQHNDWGLSIYTIYLVFTRGQFWPSGIVVACVCLSVCPSVRLCVR